MDIRVQKNNHKSIKAFVKRGLQHVAAKFGRHTRANKEPQLLILMYHRILPLDDDRAKIEEPGMVVSPETFRLHLTTLKKYFNIIKLSDWIQLKHEGKPLPANACAITFDDGWADNYEFAFPILQEQNTPATIFLVAEMIGTKDMFWPERLARLVTTIATNYPQHWTNPELAWLQSNLEKYQFSKTPPNSEDISSLIASVKNHTDQELHDRISRAETLLQLDVSKYSPSLLDWHQVEKMTDSGLIEIGSHTCRHIRLNEQTSDEQIKNEIVNSKEIIKQHTRCEINTFCFPNGDYSPLSLELVQQNYVAAVTTQTGWNTASTDHHLLQRIGVHQDIAQDKTSFLARISGWM